MTNRCGKFPQLQENASVGGLGAGGAVHRRDDSELSGYHPQRDV